MAAMPGSGERAGDRRRSRACSSRERRGRYQLGARLNEWAEPGTTPWSGAVAAALRRRRRTRPLCCADARSASARAGGEELYARRFGTRPGVPLRAFRSCRSRGRRATPRRSCKVSLRACGATAEGGRARRRSRLRRDCGDAARAKRDEGRAARTRAGDRWRAPDTASPRIRGHVGARTCAGSRGVNDGSRQAFVRRFVEREAGGSGGTSVQVRRLVARFGERAIRAEDLLDEVGGRRPRGGAGLIGCHGDRCARHAALREGRVCAAASD